MKASSFIFYLVLLISCNQPDKRVVKMQSAIDSLQKKLNETYKPGFGEFMSGIQTHHAKLWFAGLNQNWKLADFEIQEIQEALEDIKQFNSDRPEAKDIGMINPAMDSVKNAIEQKNYQQFTSSFTLLTNTCNNCHKTTEHGFNVVTIPSSQPVFNQDFKSVQ